MPCRYAIFDFTPRYAAISRRRRLRQLMPCASVSPFRRARQPPATLRAAVFAIAADVELFAMFFAIFTLILRHDAAIFISHSLMPIFAADAAADIFPYALAPLPRHYAMPFSPR